MLLLITSLALETARGVGSRGQLERSGGLARVAGTALHASGECLVRRAFDLCAGQRAAQLSIFATLQRRRTAAALLLITSLALESARGFGSRGQLERKVGLARVAGTALHASGECLVRRAFDLCAGQRAAQLSIFATLQRRRTAATLLLITSLALESARGCGSRGQLERSGGLARVAGTALHASGECLVCRTFNLCAGQLAAQFTIFATLQR